MTDSKDDWGKNSRLVLQSLKKLEYSVNSLNERIGALEKQLCAETTKERRIESLEGWKTDCESLMNKRQMENVLKEMEEMKVFKTRATFIFSVIQAGIFILVFVMKFIKFK